MITNYNEKDEPMNADMPPELTSKQRILQCASQEFLTHGWKNSTIRGIAKGAGVTTGSVYFHFKNKAALFEALVEDVYKTLLRHHHDMYETFFAMPLDKDAMRAFRFEGRKRTVDLIYQNYKAVKLLVCCSEGTDYADFFNLMMEDTYKADVRAFTLAKNHGGALNNMLDIRLYSAIDKSFWHCLFETVRLDIPYEQALEYVAVLDDFYETGWQRILGNYESCGTEGAK
jgi:Transcriptional regulator|nr:TetR/AcrR family transcriptional regulator [uncultured Treponema sp.]